MADERLDLRDISVRQLLPWTEIFRGFQIALDPKKLLLAAGGILVMSLGWWLFAWAFYSSREVPEWKSGKYANWTDFKADRKKWELLYEAAGDRLLAPDANDLAEKEEEFEPIRDAIAEGKSSIVLPGTPPRTVAIRPLPPGGKLRTLPWFEDRGPNPYLLVTGQAGHPAAPGAAAPVPWEGGRFWDWLLTKQIPVLIEPLVKFLRPVVYLLNADAGFWNRIYFVLDILWALATWAFFAGAITRMAAVQIARKEKIGMTEAIRFTIARYLSFFSAPLFPLIFVLVALLFLIVYGAFHLIPVLGDVVVDGLGYPLVILAGLAMAVVLFGLVGWPMMYATISTEGSDSFDALSRSYSYVYQSPWQYIWYVLVALAYGIVVVFFVGFMGSLMVYLGKWGIDQTPFISQRYLDREPEFLYVYAPTSFGWRDLLLQGNSAIPSTGPISESVYQQYLSTLKTWNVIGAIMVAFWLYLIFLLILGFAYSYFWSASTIIYLLMRRKVDDTEMDEVYLEEDDSDDAFNATPTVAPASSPAPATTGLTMVDPPSLKTPGPGLSASAPARVETTPPPKGDGNPPAGGAIS